jgi:hypothetical protein
LRDTWPRLTGPARKGVDHGREALERRLLFEEIALEPPQRRSFVLWRSAFGVELDELAGFLQRQLRQLARCILRAPEVPAFDRAAEANVRGLPLSRTYVRAPRDLDRRYVPVVSD